MIEARQSDRLALEAPSDLGHRRPLAIEHLDRDGALQAHLLGAIHAAHAALADQLDDLVPAVDDLAEDRRSLGRAVGLGAAAPARGHTGPACSNRTR